MTDIKAENIGLNDLPPMKKQKLSENGHNSTKNEDNGKPSENDPDHEYFFSYSDIELHRTMIEDQVRTTAYQQAIFQKMENYINGKVVADVGCGTGILSMFCAQAGAKKVYAIEASKIAHQAKQLVEANGFKDIITVLHGKAEELELPEKVDVIVSEWMGYMLLYETMLPSVLHIRDKWLKPGGKMFPERAVLNMALADAQWINRYEEGTYDFWISINHIYDLDMTVLADKSVDKYKDLVHVHMIAQEDVISFPSIVCDLDLNTIKAEDIMNISHNFKLKSMGSRELNGIVLWFDVYFPDGSQLSTSPDKEDTHWQNAILPLTLCRVQQDDEVKGTLKISQNDLNRRFIDVKLDYSVKDRLTISKSFKMDDNCSDYD